MEWTDITIEVSREFAQAATAIATGVSNNGLYIEDYEDLEKQVLEIAHIDLIEQDLLDQPRDIVKIHLYLSPEDSVAACIEALQGRFLSEEIVAKVTTTGVKQEDWENSWKKYFHPIEIGNRLVVVPSWEEYTGERVQLLLDPGMAFGTGTHETTYLCLAMLDKLVKGGESLLDIGTGSGILAVAALLLGADSALGIDIDPMCVKTADENARRNKVEKNFVAVAGDLAQKATGKYTIITANIVADAIIRLGPSVLPLLEEDGIFIASGIIKERAAEVEAALDNCGLQQIEKQQKGGWVALAYKK